MTERVPVTEKFVPGKIVPKKIVLGKIAELLAVDAASIDPDAPLFLLAVSSFRIVELVIELQEEFGVSFGQEDMNRVATVGDLADLVAACRCDRSGR